MRLFTAVHFSEETNQRFSEYIDILKENAKGNFTKPINLHMTLIFIGETTSETAEKIKEIMKKNVILPEPNSKSISVKFTEIGRFKRGNESLVWAGGESSELSKIHLSLSSAFRAAGIEADIKKFVPHVTLGRRIQFKNLIRSEKEIDEFLKSVNVDLKAPVSRISLMKSDLTPNGPIYKELFTVSF